MPLVLLHVLIARVALLWTPMEKSMFQINQIAPFAKSQ
jgi:hypothetical protein